MKMKLFFKIIFIVFLSVCGLNANAQCKAKTLVKQFKSELKPFEYDSYAINDITFKKEKQIVEVIFTAYAGLDYRMVFCTSSLATPIGITIYDKPKTNKKRKPIYFTESGKDGYLCTFTPKTTGSYYIEYEVPASSTTVAEGSKGCILMLIGIKER